MEDVFSPETDQNLDEDDDEEEELVKCSADGPHEEEEREKLLKSSTQDSGDENFRSGIYCWRNKSLLLEMKACQPSASFLYKRKKKIGKRERFYSQNMFLSRRQC